MLPTLIGLSPTHRGGEFHNYNRSGNWGITTAKRIRMYIPAFINMAYLYSSDEFKNRFINFEYELYDNKKVPIDRRVVYEKILADRKLTIGVVEKVEGLASPSIFGVHQRFLDESAPNKRYYDPNDTRTRENWAHEFGHVLGYSHDSNMTYKSDNNKGHGYNEIVIKLYKEMLEAGELPFSQFPY